MSDAPRHYLAAGISGLAIVGFGAIHATASIASLSGPAPGWVTAPRTEYVAGALTGLVSGIVALIFGISSSSTDGPNTPLSRAAKTRTFLAPGSRVLGLRSTRSEAVRSVLSWSYVGCYIVIALLALLAFLIADPQNVPSYTDGLALAGLGTFVAIANGFLTSDK